MKQTIYLDNSTVTRPSDLAVSAMIPFFTDMWGCPSAPHDKGQHLFPTLKKSYQELYDFLGARKKDTMIFTSSGAEAINQVIHSVYQEVTLSDGKNHFLTACSDEAPAIMAINQLTKRGCVAKMVEVNSNGEVTLEAIGDALTPRTAMLSLSWGNGLTGVIQPVEEIAAFCKERSILLHLDASHIIGKMYFDLADVDPDYISFDGCTIHGPRGTGVLYVKEGAPCSSLISGGMEQGGYRAGCLNVAALAGLGTAVKEARECRDLVCIETARLRDRLEDGISRGLPDAIFFFKEQLRLPHCTTIGFPGVVNEALLYLLNSRGVFASIGGGSFQQIGLILKATGVPDSLAQSAVSFSLSRETTEDEIEQAIEIIVDAAKQLKKSSEKIKV